MGNFLYSIIFLLAISVCCKCRDYRNYSLLRSTPTDSEDLEFLKYLHKVYDVHYWRYPAALRKPVDFIISSQDKMDLLSTAKMKNISLTTVIEDVQSRFDEQTKNYQSYLRRNMDTFNWRDYSRLSDIYDWLDDLHHKFPDEVQIKTIGTTYEGRDIKAVKVALNGVQKSAKVVIEGGIHAREWISVAFVTYLINEVVNSRFRPDKKFSKIAEFYEWHFIPITNPDGYEYTHTTDRMWRTNRRGIDLNRNFGIAFGTSNGIHPKEENYQGPRAFSEMESYSLAKYIRTLGKNVAYYLAFHCYGQYLILPYCYSTDHILKDYDAQLVQVNAFKTGIKKMRNTEYTVGTAIEQVGYNPSGVSSDWAKKALNIPYVLSIEMNDDGEEGFALSPSQIEPVCRETMEGLKVYLKFGMKRDIPSNEPSRSQANVLLTNYLVIYCIVLVLKSIFE